MIHYTKIINSRGSYFIREHIKIKKHKNKIRQLREITVKNHFLEGNAEILVILEDLDKEILINYFSDTQTIVEYLGNSFIPK